MATYPICSVLCFLKSNLLKVKDYKVLQTNYLEAYSNTRMLSALIDTILLESTVGVINSITLALKCVRQQLKLIKVNNKYVLLY